MATLIAPTQSLGRDADLYVDDLYADAPDVGATLLVLTRQPLRVRFESRRDATPIR